MVTVWPATFRVVERVSPGFTGTVKPTLPEPVCDVGVVIVTNELPPLTVHVHVLPVLTPIVALPPAPDRLIEVLVRENVHCGVVGVVVVVGDVGVRFSEHAASPTEINTNARML
ncbi:MAG TPA: hypothetical protein VEC39_17655 [Vicinamibacterales bacterium]|nr:hypothetical protein [Vicinamibacterales bacterium]